MVAVLDSHRADAPTSRGLEAAETMIPPPGSGEETRPRPGGRRGPVPEIVILGAGVSGLCMAMQLVRAGIESFTILEKAESLGGTWHDNTYPGVACDVPSHLYCFSFEPNPDWSHKYSPQSEILAYVERCARKYDLGRHIRFGTEVAGAAWDDEAGVWRVRTTAGEEIVADVLVSGVGQLNRPHMPSIPGLESAERPHVFHSARWDRDYALRGKRVAVIGNGASAIQLIPEIAREVAHLSIFQRSPNWLVPRNDRAYSEAEKNRFRRHPLLLRLYRSWIWAMLEKNFMAFRQGTLYGKLFGKAALMHLERQVADPRLRALLRPDYPVGCKRVLISDDYYPAVQRENVAIVTTPIERITAGGVRTADGREHAADAIIFATGFETTKFLAPMEIRGAGGERLEDVWKDGAEAYLGMTVPGFPNFFMLYGPNTNLGHNSIIFMVECQTGYVVQCMREMIERDLVSLDVRPEVMAHYNQELQKDIRSSVWAAGCDSWYKTESGRITNNWSSYTASYWWQTRRPKLPYYTLRYRADEVEKPATRPVAAAV